MHKKLSMKLIGTLWLLILAAIVPAGRQLKAEAGKAVKVVSIVVAPTANPRIVFGAERVSSALTAAGYSVKTVKQSTVPSGAGYILIGVSGDPLVANASRPATVNGKP